MLMIFSDGSQYEGELKDNMRHGSGKMIYCNKDVFEGQWKKDKKEGDGIYTHASGTKIEGTFSADEPFMTCTVTRPDGKAKKVDFKQEQDPKDGQSKVIVCRWKKEAGDKIQQLKEGFIQLVMGRGIELSMAEKFWEEYKHGMIP